MGLIILYFLGALSMSFLCSVLEAVLLSTPMSFITMKESQGNKTASLMKDYKDNVDRPVGAILSLNTIAHTIGSAGVGAESIKLFGEEYFGIVSAVLTLLILVLSEIIPKTIGASYWRSLAMPSTKIIRILIVITYPLVLLSELITKVFTPKGKQSSMSREEVSAMVDVGTTEGVFRESESKIIKNCIRLSGIKAKDAMTPFIVVESANMNLTVKDFYKQQEWNFSRIPVYDKDKEYITGYVLKDMVLKYLSEDKFQTKLSDLIRPILSFGEGESLYHIWEKMLEKREHISIIVDEYGGTSGLVTMEDIIEELVGEIYDEHDAVALQDIVQQQDGSYRVLCGTNLDKMFDFFDVEEEVDATTVNGWVDNLPKVGDSFVYEADYKRFEVKVTKADARKALEINMTVTELPRDE